MGKTEAQRGELQTVHPRAGAGSQACSPGLVFFLGPEGLKQRDSYKLANKAQPS